MKQVFLTGVLLISAGYAAAQVRIGISAGVGGNYVSKEHVAARYEPSILPQGDFNLDIPLSGDFHLLTGMGYKVKGYKTMSVLRDQQMDAEDFYTTQTRYNYLQIPVLVSYTHPFPNGNKLQFGGGLYYGFLLNARVNAVIDHYDNGRFEESTKYSFYLRTGLTPSGAETPSGKRTEVLMLDCGLKLQVNYILQRHFTVSIFHEHSLYDIHVRNSNNLSSLKLRTTGISLGYIF